MRNPKCAKQILESKDLSFRFKHDTLAVGGDIAEASYEHDVTPVWANIRVFTGQDNRKKGKNVFCKSIEIIIGEIYKRHLY